MKESHPCTGTCSRASSTPYRSITLFLFLLDRLLQPTPGVRSLQFSCTARSFFPQNRRAPTSNVRTGRMMRQTGEERRDAHTHTDTHVLNKTKQKTKSLQRPGETESASYVHQREMQTQKQGALSRHDVWKRERSQVATGLMSLYHRKRLTPFMGSAALQQRDVTLGCIRRAVCAKKYY